MVRENNKNYTSIYDPFLLKIVSEIFNNGENDRIIAESDFLELINRYFNKIRADGIFPVEKRIMEAIYNLYFYDKYSDTERRIPISEFKLIKDDYYKIDVFVEIDDTAENVWKKYNNIKLIKDTFERKNQFLKIKKLFYEYVISIPKSFKNQVTSFNEKLDIGYISKDDLENSYSFETGFKRDKKDIASKIF